MKKKNNESKKSFSRRNFLKVSGLAVGAAGMGLLTGCGGDSNTNVTVYGGGGSGGSSPLPETWDDEADFILVGYGGAAAMAAIHVHKQDPAAKILALEVNTAGGGATKICGGGTYLGGGTAVQIEAGFTQTADELYKTVVAATGLGSDKALLRKFADTAKATYDALVGTGLRYEGFLPRYKYIFEEPQVSLYESGEHRPERLAAAELVEPAGPVLPVPGSHFCRTESSGLRGGVLWQHLHEAASANTNLSVSYSTKAKSLVVNDDGRVVGVVAEKDGAVRYCKAGKAVLISAGGFTDNYDMVAQFLPHAFECHMGGAGYDNGDGIKMAQAVGADLYGMDFSEDFYNPLGSNAGTTALVKGIVVNDKGVRFIGEDTSPLILGRFIARVYDKAFCIFDQSIRDEISESAWEALSADTETAATLTELADKLGLPEGCLEDTVARYNATAVAGIDVQFRKESPVVTPIAVGAFYGYKLSRSRVFAISCGGLRINTDAQVLNTAGEPIPGLYAAGASAATINAQYYVGSGGGTAGAFVFGLIAGLEMVKETAWE